MRSTRVEAERSDGVLQPIAKRLDRDLRGDVLLEVLVDERCKRRRLVASALSE